MLDANGEVHQVKAEVIRVIATAYALAPGQMPIEEIKNRALADLDRIGSGAQGNRPRGSQMSKADKALIFEGALRRALEILNP